MRPEAEILAVGMVTPIGLSARQTAASVRTGIGRLRESYVSDRHGQLMVMGLVDEDELPPLSEEIEDREDVVIVDFEAVVGPEDRSLSPRQARLARLAGPALIEALGSGPREAPPLLLATPETRAETRYPIGPEMIEILAAQTGRRLDEERSRTYPLGRAGPFAAIEEALDRLQRRQVPSVMVGAVDSYLDLGLLEALDDEGRLKTGEIPDGFVPGEGAAFLQLAPVGTAARRGARPLARITGVGRAHEPGHLYSAEPHRADGLAAAFGALFDAGGGGRPPAHEVSCVYAGLNGESFWAKEWGVAQIRHAARLREPLRVEHPADGMGDAGAALGLIMLGLGALELSRGRISGECLVWCGADHGERGAALLSR